MKYGLIVDFGQAFCNYGDLIQSVAIEYVYNKMGITPDQIMRLTKKDLVFYDGDPILLPFNYTIFYLIDFVKKDLLLSDKIIPVFLGVSIESIFVYDCIPLDVFSSENSKWLDLFRKSAPIGCRDMYTLEFMKKHGISAYLQGCISNIFPKRATGEYKKTLLVDCPQSILPYIPSSLLENAEALSNVVPLGNYSIEENFQKVKERYDYYMDTASLVVTSRYHVALPCNAMGIPSVLVKPPISKFSQDIRFDTIPPQVQICSTENDYENVNWYTEHEDFPAFKVAIFEMAATRIREAFIRHGEQTAVEDFFRANLDAYNVTKEEHISYKSALKTYVSKYHTRNHGKFYIWGAMDILCDGNKVKLAEIIMQINPNLKFAGFIDTYREGELSGLPIIRPNRIDASKNDFIVIPAESAFSAALSHFKTLEFTEHNYIFLSEQMIKEENLV